MTRSSPVPTRVISRALLGGCLLGAGMAGWSQEQAPTQIQAQTPAQTQAQTQPQTQQQAQQQPGRQSGSAAPTPQQAMSAQQALQAMAGMGGIFRKAPGGDLYLYPAVKLRQSLNGMHGTYRITPRGIILMPTGMDAPDLGMDSMGGVAGSFRVTPDGSAYFQPTPHAPVGMSGETGRGNP